MDDVVLIDMNAAKQASDKTEDTTLLGTKGYAAPEQYGFGSSNVQTDIYAIGIVMNTMISGRYSQEIQNGKLSTIIKKCTQLSPENRYKSITELSDALRAISAKPPSRIHTGWRNYLPPGFRSGNYIFMLIATFYYIFTFWICKDLTFKDATEHSTLILRSGCFLICISIALCTCNYAGIQDRFKIHKINNPILRMFGIILLNLIVSFTLILLTVLLNLF